MIAIAYYRKKAKLTQMELAEKLDVDRTTVSKWESGKANPKTKMMPAIADICGIGIDELYKPLPEYEMVV